MSFENLTKSINSVNKKSFQNLSKSRNSNAIEESF